MQDTVLLVATTVVGMCVSLITLAWAYQVSSANLRAFLIIFAPVPFSLLTFAVRNSLLGLFTIGRSCRMRVGPERPVIDVIIPAYNEEEVIVGTLQSIDAAAAYYGGPVNVIMTDDGSTDETRPLAEAAMAAYTAACGRIIDGPHGGKSAALNLALGETTARHRHPDRRRHHHRREGAVVTCRGGSAIPEVGLVEALHVAALGAARPTTGSGCSRSRGSSASTTVCCRRSTPSMWCRACSPRSVANPHSTSVASPWG